VPKRFNAFCTLRTFGSTRRSFRALEADFWFEVLNPKAQPCNHFLRTTYLGPKSEALPGEVVECYFESSKSGLII
jgi:hypothetical protein